MAGMGVQELIVALAALGAAAVVVRRLVGGAARDAGPGCAKCAAGDRCAPAPAAGPQAPTPPAAHPLTIVRPARR